MPRKRSFCTIAGCNSPAKGQGFCLKHYSRLRIHGDPLGGAPERNRLLPWLREHVTYAGDDCLRWPFGDRGNGYGSVRYEGRHTSASRLMCLFAHGEPPTPAADAAHSCGNGHLGCVNPRHLRWATRRENVHDAMTHGTASRGPDHSAAIKRAFAAVPMAERKRAVTELRKEGEAA